MAASAKHDAAPDPKGRRALRSRAVARVVLSILGMLSFLGLWAALSEWEFEPFVLPSPFAVVDNMGVLLGEGLVTEAFLKSLQKTLMGWAAAMVIGIPIGLLMGRYRYARAFFHDFVYVLSNVPLVVYAVISLVVFGISDIGPAFVVMLLVLPAVSINVAAGVASADQGLLAMSRAFGRSGPDRDPVRDRSRRCCRSCSRRRASRSPIRGSSRP